MPDVIMPKMGDAMEEGTLLAWRKNDGDQVKVGEIIAEIETDKAVQLQPSAMDAILLKPARHHLIIGSPRINGFAAMRSAAHIMGGFQFAFGEGPGTINVLVSLYGPSSVLMLMNDAFWAKSKAYELAAELGDMPTAKGELASSVNWPEAASMAKAEMSFDAEFATYR